MTSHYVSLWPVMFHSNRLIPPWPISQNVLILAHPREILHRVVRLDPDQQLAHIV